MPSHKQQNRCLSTLILYRDCESHQEADFQIPVTFTLDPANSIDPVNMDVDGQTNLPEVRMSDCRSFSSNYRCCSQSRKISIGVLIDSMSKAEAKNEKEAVTQIAENGTSSKGNCVKDREGHTPLVEKYETVVQKDSSPWVSTRSFNPKISSSVAARDTEHSPNFPATSRKRPLSKLSEKASAAHSLKSFACKTGLESDECRNKNFGKATYSFEREKVDNTEHVENLGFSAEPRVLLEKEQVEDKDRKTETGGRETLRMKLWEVLGNVSPSDRHCPRSQSVELYPERDGKQSPIEKRNPNSDTIESDSEKHSFKRPMTRSLTRKKASAKKQRKRIEATKPTYHRKEGSENLIFSFRGDCSGRLYSNLNDGSLPSKRNKSVRASSEVRTNQGHQFENSEERQQSVNNVKSIPAVDKSMMHRNEVLNANSSNERRTDVLVEPKCGSKKSNPSVSPVNVMTEKQKDAEQPTDVEISNLKKDQQEGISESLLKNKRNSIRNPSTSRFEVTSHGCLSGSKQRKLQDQSPAEKIFNTKGIRSFKSLLSSNSAEHIPNVQVESSRGKLEINDSLLRKPSLIVEEDSESQMFKSSTGATDSESSEDDLKGRETEQLSPEICVAKKIQLGRDKSLGNKKDVEEENVGSPLSDSLTGTQISSQHQMCLKQNHEDGLASAVALFAIALDRVKNKLKSISSKRSAEILRDAGEEIYLLLQNAESHIKTDLRKLTNLSQLKRKQLETRLQDQQEQLVGIHRRFTEEVDRHLKDYDSVVEDLEEHEIEVKRSVERQRSAHKNILLQVEQEVQSKLDAAESRVVAVQELAREKMLQLKLVVAESVKHGALC